MGRRQVPTPHKSVRTVPNTQLIARFVQRLHLGAFLETLQPHPCHAASEQGCAFACCGGNCPFLAFLPAVKSLIGVKGDDLLPLSAKSF